MGGMQRVDFAIVGAGIVGLAIARELRARHPAASILVLEKEAELAAHQSGRNSGVMHSGVYYKPESLKAKVCAQGARLMKAYVAERGLPHLEQGKVILPVRADDDAMLDELLRRGLANGATPRLIAADELAELEPDARSLTGRALYVPETSVIDPKATLKQLAGELQAADVALRLGCRVAAVKGPEGALVLADGGQVSYGHLFNAAGLHADAVAESAGLPAHYAMMPFKGLYQELRPGCGLRVNRLIYPVPDMAVPFLGVHFTPSTNGHVYVGPTAIPAFGREHYRGVEGLEAGHAVATLVRLAGQYLADRQGFRGFTHAEAGRFLPARFIEAGQALMPGLRQEHLMPSAKVGLRAQLYDRRRGELVMDFLLEHSERATHVMNAVSPAYTSAFAFAPLVVDAAEAALRGEAGPLAESHGALA